MSFGFRFQDLWMGLGIGAVLLVILLSLAHIEQPFTFSGVDKYQHFLVYAGLMYGWGMLQPDRKIAWALGLAAMGASLEFIQTLTGYRQMDVWDAVANIAGVLTACLVLTTRADLLLGWLDRKLAHHINSGSS